MNDNKASIIITNFFRNVLLKNQEKKIKKIFNKYKSKFYENSRELLTDYEKAFGFTNENRTGNRKFSQILGKIMEEIYNISYRFTKLNEGDESGCDGKNDNTFFESKLKYNTMKGSEAYSEISKKLLYSIKNNKNFYLFCLTDRGNGNNIKSLHYFNSLKRIENIEGYNRERHLYLSGNKIFEFLFPTYNILIKTIILNNISLCKIYNLK